VDNGSGGTGLGPFQAKLDLPPPLTWTNETQINDIPRTADLTVTWSGGDPDREFVVIAGVSVNTATKAQASFLCSERAAAGRFVVPATVLASLPASSEWTGAGTPSLLGVVSLPLVAGTTFTAPGLDLGLFSYTNVRLKVVHYRDASLAWPGTTWNRVESLEKAGWSRERLNIARAFSDYIGSTGVMIVEGGLVVDEWGETASRSWLYSIWKSVLSALYGAPVQDGRIRLDQTMAELGIDDIPPALTPEEKQATVRHLLQARSGVYHVAVADTPDVVAVRPPRGSHPPGTHWYYNNWDVNVLGAIFERAAGRGFFEEVKRRIAEPIQMEDFRLEDGYYERGPASIHPAYPMKMTARDLARFGLLCLRQGQWRGQQIIPREWLRESTTSYSDAGPAGGYGYLWWVSVDGRHFPGVTVDEGSYSARGMYGQFLVIIPRRDLVVVHRVNRDITGREVGYTQFGRLLRMILEAKTSESLPDAEEPSPAALARAAVQL
jgi:CubicO group peptidase (beta-lactamase class C family)